MATGNAINANSTGLVRYNGTGTFDAVTTTNHNLLIGAASNGITNVAPSATSGVPIISQGASSDPVFGTAAIAGGGTNATSMSTSTGIVKYDGTSLVTSSTAKIDSSNRYTNTSQPCFLVYTNASLSNKTGDGTNYTVVFNTTQFDQASNFSSGTTFTAPVTGKYLFCVNLLLAGFTASFTDVLATLVTPVSSFTLATISPGKVFETNSGQNFYFISASQIAPMSANDTASVAVLVTGSTKTIGLASGLNSTNFSGVLLC